MYVRRLIYVIIFSPSGLFINFFIGSGCDPKVRRAGAGRAATGEMQMLQISHSKGPYRRARPHRVLGRPLASASRDQATTASITSSQGRLPIRPTALPTADRATVAPPPRRTANEPIL